MATNKAAFIPNKGETITVGDAKIPEPGAGEIVIKNSALAINPVDWKIQDGYMPAPFPVILGEDVAGEVYAVGSGVTNFAKGDRVIA